MKGIKVALIFLFGGILASAWWSCSIFVSWDGESPFTLIWLVPILASIGMLTFIACWIGRNWEDNTISGAKTVVIFMAGAILASIWWACSVFVIDLGNDFVIIWVVPIILSGVVVVCPFVWVTENWNKDGSRHYK